MKKWAASSKKRERVFDVIAIIVGTALYALGVHVFTAPNHIAPGGATGIATVLNYLLKVPIGATVVLINVPLLAVGYRFIGKPFFFKTLLSTAVFSLTVDFLYKPVPVYTSNPVIASLFGGALIGVGLAVVFLREGSTGGVDITNKLIQRKFPHMKLGMITFCTDVIIIFCATIAYGQLESGLYAILAMFVSSKALDRLLYGAHTGKMLLIVSEKSDEIAQAIIDMNRGVTKLRSVGAYSNTDRTTLVCAVEKNEYVKVKHLVHGIDPSAFMIISDASEVLGEGFRPLNKD